MSHATALTVGSLFSGIGGIDLGLQRAGMEITWQCEKDPWCRKILAKHWPEVPKYEDIRSINWGTVEPVDLVCGGFPCQPFSLAGKQKGADDFRNMWPEYRRCVEALRPTWVLGENVSGAKRYLKAVCRPDLEAIGYRVRVYRLPACAGGAPHQRMRFFIIAHQEQGCRCPADESFHKTGSREEIGDTGIFPNTIPIRQQKQREPLTNDSWGELGRVRAEYIRGWPPEPGICRMAHGVPHRVDRLRGLGNAVVPQIVEWLGRCIYASHCA